MLPLIIQYQCPPHKPSSPYPSFPVHSLHICLPAPRSFPLACPVSEALRQYHSAVQDGRKSYQPSHSLSKTGYVASDLRPCLESMWYIHAGSLGNHCSTWVQARELVYIGQTVSLAFQRETANMAETPEANSTHDYPPVVCLINWSYVVGLLQVPDESPEHTCLCIAGGEKASATTAGSKIEKRERPFHYCRPGISCIFSCCDFFFSEHGTGMGVGHVD